MERIQTYTITNQSITSPFLLCTYISNDNRNLTFELFLSGLYGNGVYKFSLTKQTNGTGTVYQAPTSFTTLASGVTTAFLPTISIPVVTGDVVKVYAEGQSFDTSISGKVEVYDSSGPTSGSIAGAVWDEVLTGATHNVPSSSGRRLRQLASSIIYMGTVVSATENTITLDSGADASTGAYDPAAISIVSGNGNGQSRNVLQYDGPTRTCTVDRDWKILPIVGDEFMITTNAGREHVNEGLAQGGTINTITLNANASSYDNTYVGQVVFIRSGMGEDQACRVTAYNGTTKEATMAKNWHTIPNDTSGYVMLPTAILDLDMYASAIATKVWTYVTRTITAGGITAQEIWEYANRTLTSVVSGLTASEIWNYARRTLTHVTEVADIIEVSSDIEIIRGESMSIDIDDLGDLSDITNLYFTAKNNYQTLDKDSIMQISTGSGLIYLNGVLSDSPVSGCIVIRDVLTGAVSIKLEDDKSILLQKNPSIRYDVKAIRGTESEYRARGTLAIIDNVTDAVI